MHKRLRNLARKIGLLAAAGAALAMPPAVSAQMFITDPGFATGPIQGSDPLVGLPIPGATPEEFRARLLWNLRAGLNVAALQCQFSPFLRAVDNYNGILAHHSEELADAYETLGDYFKRTHGAKEGQKRFDDYTTMTYNNFSTLQAQYGFCQVAADIARHVLAAPKGQLYAAAQERMRELRASLTPAYDRVADYNPYLIAMPTMPPFNEDCWKRDQLREKCRAALAAQ
ncbi:hypothetical protein [Allosphingosinicella sp.]|uniref:hypothetical protein n=1 Tax=Allosphingosinicella sp. TaxID=2823234 RepID=UPI002FC23FEE